MSGPIDAPRDDDVVALYEDAPCGYLSTTPDGRIIRVNQTFLTWTGYQRDDLVDRITFVELLTVGGRIYHETHYLPMLQMQGKAHEIALDIVGVDGRRLPTLVNSVMERDPSTGNPRVIRVIVFDATERRRYEQQLVVARKQAEDAEAQARRIAVTLQKTLIPPALPTIDGLDIAAVYRPAGSGAEIGGDFYDVFQISSDHWMLVIGDVQGKGVDAAVLTALARYTIRAHAIQHHSPAAVLRGLNEAMRIDPTDRLCTALIISLTRLGDGRWRAVVGSGGHPLPMLSRPGNETHEIGRPGSLLGFFDDGVFHDDEVELQVGELFVVYTDGVSEARRGTEFFGETRIASIIPDGDRTAASVAARLLDGVLDFEGGVTRDDVALAVVRIAEPSS